MPDGPRGARPSAMPMRSGYAACRDLEVHDAERGAPGAPAVPTWHGVARTGRDFDVAAAAPAGRYRAICPGQIGRGLSQWSAAPREDYCLAVCSDIARDLADALGLGVFSWIGTSMGGAFGTVAGATTFEGRIARMAIDDIGPALPGPAVARILAYVGAPPGFATFGQFAAWVRQVHAPFGRHSDGEWRHPAETAMRRLPDGRATPHDDPRIVAQFEHYPGDCRLRDVYDALSMPVLLPRGETGDLLAHDMAEAMTRRGPRARLHEIPGCGHAPGLNTQEQIAIVADFLDGRIA